MDVQKIRDAYFLKVRDLLFEYPTEIIYTPRCIEVDVWCSTVLGMFGVPMQPYIAILRESEDQSINNHLIIAPGSMVVTRNSFLRLAFGQNHDFIYPSKCIVFGFSRNKSCLFPGNKSMGPGPGPGPRALAQAHKGPPQNGSSNEK